MRFFDRIAGWFHLRPRIRTATTGVARGQVDHVVIIDGSMSSLKPGCETNAGLLYKLLLTAPTTARIHVRYEAGIQWRNWRSARDVIEGRGINRQIRKAYGSLASRYRPGDRIFLFGYSRGAYAVRSLAGVLGRVGLLRPEYATVRHIRDAYRHYERDGQSDAARAFRDQFCHDSAEIEMLGVWDTVKALGLRLPVLWRLTDSKHQFHDHELGRNVWHAYHALARDETREAFAPVLWEETQNFPGEVEQVWFRGSHGDVGGQLGGFEPARPLSNIPLVWMLERAEACGLALPEGWSEFYPCNPHAPSVGTLRGWGPLFLARKPRKMLRDRSERLHATAMLEPPLAPDAKIHEGRWFASPLKLLDKLAR